MRNPFLDFAKGVLITLVIIGHTVQFVAYQNPDFWSDPLFKAIYLFHMPLFMAISGYVAYAGIRRLAPWPLLRGKLPSYLLPAFTWAILFHATQWFFPPHYTLKAMPMAILDEMTRLWFLWALVVALAVTALVKTTGKYFWVCYPLSTIAVFFLPETSIVFLFKYTYPFFQIGFLLADGKLPSLNRSRRYLLLIASGILTLACYALWTTETYIYASKMARTWENLPNIALLYTAGLGGSVVVMIAINLLFKFIPAKLQRQGVSLGKNSLSIYIIQTYIFVALDAVRRNFALPLPSEQAKIFVSLFLGVALAYTCNVLGTYLTKNRWAALILFGKTIKPTQTIEAEPTPPWAQAQKL